MPKPCNSTSQDIEFKMANTNPANNNNNNNHQDPFQDLDNLFGPRHFNSAGVGVDHASVAHGPSFWGSPHEGAPFHGPWEFPRGWGHWGGGGPWGRGGFGRRGNRRHQRHSDDHAHDFATEDEPQEQHEVEKSPDTMGDAPNETLIDENTHTPHAPPPPPPPFPAGPHHRAPPHSPPPPSPHPHGPGSGHRGHDRGRGRGCPWPHGRRWHSHGPIRGHHEIPPVPEYTGPFDLRPLMHAFARHPFAESIREYLDQGNARAPQAQPNASSETFVPPVDTFDTEAAYVLHVALPGCSKEDVGVHWDPEKSTVNIAGVVYRPGDETFKRGLVTGERKIGMFERSVKLPPHGVAGGEDIDGFNITAKMENGLLVVTIPKVEKEWTEMSKVDIE